MKKIAAIQMASSPNVGANLIEAGRLIEIAAKQGAQLIVLPENFAHMGHEETDKLKVAETFGSGPIQEFLSNKAAKHKVWILGGAIPIKSNNPAKIRAVSLLFNDKGEQISRYDKIHLFDVQIQENGEKYTESETIEAGSEITVTNTPVGNLGIAICYDLRFPELFRDLLTQGMEVLAIPSAFTAITGKAHWDILVRARAIENQCYVVAAAQGGYHINGRETYGHSMIVDPWGQVLDILPQGSGVVCAEIDLERLASIRRSFPAIEHARLSCDLDSLAS